MVAIVGVVAALLLGYGIYASQVLGIGAALEAAPTAVLGLDAAISSLASIYLLSSIYLLLALINSHYVQQLKLQVLGDLLAVTLLIYLSKEAASPYSSLYLLIITYATLLIGKNTGVAAAAGSTILYIGMIDLAFFDLIPFGSTYNKSQGQPGYNRCMDYNDTNAVNLSDFALFGSHYLHKCF